MNIYSAMDQMRAPSNMHIICIDVTNKCDLACSNCTRLLENQEGFWEMSTDNFRAALRSLEGYFGVIAVIGGNPLMHRNFEDLCQIFIEEVPNIYQRGLWTNNVFKKRELCLETFGTFNLNAHGNDKAFRELNELAKQARARRRLVWNYEGHSEHAPLLTASQDLHSSSELWSVISKCEINRDWSATITQNNGQLRAYFCEVAAAFDLATGGDFGIEPQPNWWKASLREFSAQVGRFCPRCGVPSKQKPSIDSENCDTYTHSNFELANFSAEKKGRKIIYLNPERIIGKVPSSPVTRYNNNFQSSEVL